MGRSAFDPEFQITSIDSKLFATIEKLGEVVRSLQWEKAKKLKLSPLQLQTLIFLKNHKAALRKPALIAEEFSVTKATVSDAIKSLLQKGLIIKEADPEDSRSTFIHLSAKGEELSQELEQYPNSVLASINELSQANKETLLAEHLKLISSVQKAGIISSPRMCFSCKFYEGDSENKHFCQLLKQKLALKDLRIDCVEHELSE
ncbi:MAG: MarR family transcriptional regulator [Bacteroidota bacterium]